MTKPVSIPTISILIIYFCIIATVSCFIVVPAPYRTRFRVTYSTRLHQNNDSNNESSNLALRVLLEKSWNENTMGIVPKSPDMAAKAAALSVNKAIEDGKNVLLVDIHMSEYDILSGSEMYDETLAVEFCVELAKNLGCSNISTGIPILLKNGKAKRLVERVLDSRGITSCEKEDSINSNEDGAIIEPELGDFRDLLTSSWNKHGDTDESQLKKEDISNSEIVFYDDFADFGDSIRSTVFISDVSNGSTEDDSRDSFDETKDEVLNLGSDPSDTNVGSINGKEQQNVKMRFRIGSLFGDEHVSSGADMFDQAKEATDKVALNDTAEDDIIIVLSACSNEEMIGVRRLVAKYGETKTIIFVNSKLDPVPREFIQNSFVVSYSFVPLLAQNNEVLDADPIKIVIMKRYPANWELYIDAGKALGDDGFQFVESIDKRYSIGDQGPPMQYVTECITKYMDFKNR